MMNFFFSDDVRRDPYPWHFCLGAALARLEASVALTDLFSRLDAIELAGDEPWEPRQALHVHGPARLPIRFTSRIREASMR